MKSCHTPQSPENDLSLNMVITGGGTGGHVYPGVAVAHELRQQSPASSIVFIGTQTGLEAKIVPHEGFSLETIDVRGFNTRGVWRKCVALSKLPYAIFRSLRILRAVRPHVVFGTGGYVSVPVIFAASLLHLPTIILEPNSQPGLANKLLSKAADKIAICFRESADAFPRKRTVLTGNPIRQEFYLIGSTPPPDKGVKFNILIVGGSLGAHSINTAMLEALEHLSDYRDQLFFIHQTGDADFKAVRAEYARKRFRADVRQYLNDIPPLFAKAHLIVARSGASTVAEIAASHRMAILIPYPHHGDHHQERNALALKDAGIARVIFQRQLSGNVLAEAILHSLNHPEEFLQVWSQDRLTNRKNAAARIVELCFELANIRLPATS